MSNSKANDVVFNNKVLLLYNVRLIYQRLEEAFKRYNNYDINLIEFENSIETKFSLITSNLLKIYENFSCNPSINEIFQNIISNDLQSDKCSLSKMVVLCLLVIKDLKEIKELLKEADESYKIMNILFSMKNEIYGILDDKCIN